MHPRRGGPATRVALLATVTAALATTGGCGNGSTTTVPAGNMVTSAPASTSTGGTASPDPTGATTSGPPPSTPGASQAATAASAQDAARGYYAALAAHDPAAAERYLAPEYLATFNGHPAFAAWVANYRSLSGLTMRPGHAADPELTQQYPGYRDLTVLPVTYTVRLRTPSANEVDGSLDRFVLVGRSPARGSWLIVDITTSP